MDRQAAQTSFRISFVEPHLKIFGGIRRIVELSNRLVDRGVPTTIYHPTGEPCEWMESRAEVRPAAEALQTDHDVVIYNDPNAHDFQLVERMRAKLKVFYILELYETRLLTGFKPALFRPRHTTTRYMKRSLQAPYLRLANATWLRDWIRERMGLDSELLLGGVNREQFHPVEVDPPGDAFRLLCSGDPRPRKGSALIREAFERVRRHHPRLELQTYHGKGIAQDDMAATYSAADLFIECSRQAGWNNPVAEAMACRVPVVCTNIGGVRDFAEDERTALLVPPGDVAATAQAIERMVTDPTLRAQLAEAGYRRISAFDWDDSTERLLEILSRHLADSVNGTAVDASAETVGAKRAGV